MLFKDSRAQLALLCAQGHAEAPLVIACRSGRTEAVASKILSIGGRIRYRDDEIDYLSVFIPLEHIEELLRFSEIQSADVDTDLNQYVSTPILQSASEFSFRSPSQERKSSARSESEPQDWPPRPSDYPLTHLYNARNDIDAEGFLKRNPTFDGRGVTVAVLDWFPDMLLPELQTATKLSGEPTDKITGLINATDPLTDVDPFWVNMQAQVLAHGGKLIYQGKEYLVPKDGTFRVGLFDERALPYDIDVNRDGNPLGSTGLFAVLWDESSGDVLVDANQNLSFVDEKPLKDYSIKHDVGWFGQDNLSTDVRETVGFGVQLDTAHKFISVNIGVGGHSSMVVGAALASRGKRGRLEGIAPGAKLISIKFGHTLHGHIEGMIRAMQHPDVDLVVLEMNTSAGKYYLPNDGRFTVTLICTRLIRKYGKPLFVPANNYAGLNTLSELGMAEGAICVGGYMSSKSVFTNNGLSVPGDDYLSFASSYGPSGNGGLKPDLIAPTNPLSLDVGYMEGGSQRWFYKLPPGYTVASGTSTATPVAAGAMALMISAAKQTGVTYDAYKLREATIMSARFIKQIDANRQGNGLVQVDASWQRLRKIQRESPLSITAVAPVQTVFSHLLENPHQGSGIYEREGWNAGDRGERTITLTRRGGPLEPVTFRLRWVGNDSTFESEDAVSLPLNVPTQLQVKIAPPQAGVHSAILALYRAAGGDDVFRILNTIVASETFTSANSFTIEKQVKLKQLDAATVFVSVPEGASALRLDFGGKKTFLTHAIVVHSPDSREDRIFTSIEDGTQTRAIQNPQPGVWEIVFLEILRFDFNREMPVRLAPASINLRAQLFKVEVSEAMPPSAENQQAYNVTLRNLMAPFPGAAVSCALGSAFEARSAIRDGEQLIFDINVLPGSERLVAKLQNTDQKEADLDLYLFDCTGNECKYSKNSTGYGGDESVSIDRPASGHWKVLVDAAYVPNGVAEFAYMDAFLCPRYGAISVTDSRAQRKSGESWKSKFNVWMAERPGDVRTPLGIISVQDANLFSQTRVSMSDVNVLTEPVSLGAMMIKLK